MSAATASGSNDTRDPPVVGRTVARSYLRRGFGNMIISPSVVASSSRTFALGTVDMDCLTTWARHADPSLSQLVETLAGSRTADRSADSSRSHEGGVFEDGSGDGAPVGLVDAVAACVQRQQSRARDLLRPGPARARLGTSGLRCRGSPGWGRRSRTTAPASGSSSGSAAWFCGRCDVAGPLDVSLDQLTGSGLVERPLPARERLGVADQIVERPSPRSDQSTWAVVSEVSIGARSAVGAALAGRRRRGADEDEREDALGKARAEAARTPHPPRRRQRAQPGARRRRAQRRRRRPGQSPCSRHVPAHRSPIGPCPGGRSGSRAALRRRASGRNRPPTRASTRRSPSPEESAGHPVRRCFRCKARRHSLRSCAQPGSHLPKDRSSVTLMGFASQWVVRPTLVWSGAGAATECALPYTSANPCRHSGSGASSQARAWPSRWMRRKPRSPSSRRTRRPAAGQARPDVAGRLGAERLDHHGQPLRDGAGSSSTML